MSDAMREEIDESVKALLIKAASCENLKDATAAVLAAVKWYETREGIPGGKEWGRALTGGGENHGG